MKNLNFFPFERNRYFYGKLLSVDDFELEQRYMNDKRRMLNRFIFGMGVVSGLYVVQVDEQTISVEAGIALDSWGREIVLDVPVIRKLSQIDGFGECSSKEMGYVYLCLEYDEVETDPVHNIAGSVPSGQEQGDVSFNKIKEDYRLFLTDREPEGEIISPADWYQTSLTVWQEGDIKITQVMPRYIQMGKKAEMKVRVENLGRDNLSFSYELVLTSLLAEGSSSLRVSFDEMLFERTGRYELSFPIQASDSPLEAGAAVLNPDTVSLRLSGEEQEVHMEGEMSAAIIREEEKDVMRREYYRTSMEKTLRSGYQQPICLARIYLVSAMDTYIVEKIENVPYDQYVYNHVIGAAQDQLMQRELILSQEEGNGWHGTGSGSHSERNEGVRIAGGEAEIFLKNGGERGDKFFSQEIMHGLGLGKVTIVLGLEKDSGKTVYGSSEIFENKEEAGADAELAACINESNGSFVIGVRLLKPEPERKIRVHWTALREAEDLVPVKNEKRIFIRPNLIELEVRQPQHLEAVCENMVEKTVSWYVKDQGGTIDETGMYTAPAVPGVYEVVAQSVAYPEIRASVFVVVREDRP